MSLPLPQLREQLRQLTETPRAAWGVVSSGCEPLDTLLPAGGFRGGTLVEWLTPAPGAGATTLALRAAQRAMCDERPLVVVDRAGQFFPPALPEDIERARLLLVRCARVEDADWACRQALRTSGVGALVTWCDAREERRLRRWQLAAERGGALGLVVRHLPHQPEACFSDVRILVTPLGAAEGRHVRLELLRSRQGRTGAVVEVSLDDDNAPALPPLPAPRRRAIGS